MKRRPVSTPGVLDEEAMRWLALPNAQPPEDVITDATWEWIERDLSLPPTARPELVRIVRLGRGNNRWNSIMRTEPPSQSRKDLARLHRLARELADGLAGEHMKIGAGTALHRAMEEAVPTPLSRLHELYPKFVQEVARLRDVLGRATEIAEQRQGVRLGENALRPLVANLQDLLIYHTDRGLVRASEKSKGRGGRATACARFVTEIAALVFESNLSPHTIDDAIKDAISEHRAVGSPYAGAAKYSPQDNDGT